MTAGGPAGGGGGASGAAGLYSVRAGSYRRSPTLNMCDAELVGTVVEEGGAAPRRLPIKASYYGGMTVGREEAARMLSGARIANMAGRRTVGLAVEMGLGSTEGVKTIGGVPFLIVFR